MTHLRIKCVGHTLSFIFSVCVENAKALLTLCSKIEGPHNSLLSRGVPKMAMFRGDFDLLVLIGQ